MIEKGDGNNRTPATYLLLSARLIPFFHCKVLAFSTRFPCQHVYFKSSYKPESRKEGITLIIHALQLKSAYGKEEKESQRLRTVKPHPPIVGLVTRQPGTMNARLLSSAFEGESASLMCLAEPVWLT